MKIIWTFTLLMIPGVVSLINVTGYSGGGVVIKCKYEDKYKTNGKYFCKEQGSSCSDLIRTETKDQRNKSGRFSLSDNTTVTLFKVNIRNLSEQDSGMYQCTIAGSNRTNSTTKVNLEVITTPQIGTVRGYSGGNISVNYTYRFKPKNRNINVCKIEDNQCLNLISTKKSEESGRFSIRDDSSAGVLYFAIEELSVNDSGRYKITVKVSEDYNVFFEFELLIRDVFSGNFLLILLVLPLLIIVGLALLFRYKKRHQSQAGGDSTSQTGLGKMGAVSHSRCDYEEIKPLPVCTIYTTAQLPTNQADSSGLYATVQKSSGDSKICITSTSAEDLNYAVVNFHKKSD